jgi:hypothetical protein
MIYYTIIIILTLLIIFFLKRNKEGFNDYSNILKNLVDLSNNLYIDINKLNLSLTGTIPNTNNTYTPNNLGINPYTSSTLDMGNYTYNFNVHSDFSPIQNLSLNIPHYIEGNSYKNLVDTINTIKTIIKNEHGPLINTTDITDLKDIVVEYDYLKNIKISTEAVYINIPILKKTINYSSTPSTYQDFIHLYCLNNLLRMLDGYTKFLVAVNNAGQDISGGDVLHVHNSLSLYIYYIFSSYTLILDVCVPYFTNQTILEFTNISTYTTNIPTNIFTFPSTVFPIDLLDYTKGKL